MNRQEHFVDDIEGGNGVSLSGERPLYKHIEDAFIHMVFAHLQLPARAYENDADAEAFVLKKDMVGKVLSYTIDGTKLKKTENPDGYSRIVSDFESLADTFRRCKIEITHEELSDKYSGARFALTEEGKFENALSLYPQITVQLAIHPITRRQMEMCKDLGKIKRLAAEILKSKGNAEEHCTAMALDDITKSSVMVEIPLLQAKVNRRWGEAHRHNGL